MEVFEPHGTVDRETAVAPGKKITHGLLVDEVLVHEHAQDLGAEEALEVAGVKAWQVMEASGGAEAAIGHENVDVRVEVEQLFQINFRNHRKIVVVDGHTAWVGGHNVGDEYMGRDPEFGHWRDTHVKITGPAALAVQLSFLEDWYCGPPARRRSSAGRPTSREGRAGMC